MFRTLNRGGGGGGGGDSDDAGVEGGWHADLLWARTGDGDLIVRQRGRTVVQAGKEWRLRRDRLPSGAQMPELFDPDLFFQMVRDLPAEARRVRAVEQTKVKDQDVLVLALTLEGDAAADFALSGALPPVASLSGRTITLARGMAARPQPQPETTVDIGLFIEPQGGDVLRVRAKVYEKGAPGGAPQFVVAGAPAGGGGFQVAVPAREAEKEDKDKEKEKDSGEPVYKKGLLERKMGQRDSSMYLKVDFTDLGKAKPPELDEAAKRLLGR
jgi:hypothetical protein